METPTIVSTSNTSCTYALSAGFNPTNLYTQTSNTYYHPTTLTVGGGGGAGSGGAAMGGGVALNGGGNQQFVVYVPSYQHGVPKMTRRFATVIVMDPNEHVPLDECILYKGDEKLTEATDQELFFELDIKNILETYNKKRVTFRNKKVTARDEFLEPAKIRDLKMVVITGAQF